MAIPINIPRQGQSVETCIMGEWYRQVGDQVKEGDILFSYETDKASFEEEAKEDGELLGVFYKEGDEVPVMNVVAVIGRKGENADDFRPDGQPAAITNDEKVREAKILQELEDKGNLSPGSQNKKIKISPLAKLKSINLGIAYEEIHGSGPNGRIIARDIEVAADKLSGKTSRSLTNKLSEECTQAIMGDFEDKKLSNMRKLIAGAMHHSLQNSAQLTHHMSADARKVLALRKAFKRKLENGEISQNITINSLVCYAVIKALIKFPQLNTHFLGDSMRWFSKVHLGLAVDTERGLRVPVVSNANDLSLEGLSTRIESIILQCRAGNINPELLSPQVATFTVSNLGNYGVEMFTPVINIPQSAILGICSIIIHPRDLGEGIFGFVPVMGLSLTYNHQALDGGEATLFLREVKEQIENIK